jgi:glycosyltransferase involved in cell wall biosynthesis
MAEDDLKEHSTRAGARSRRPRTPVLVIVGPTPPPVGGQTVMVDLLLRNASRFPEFRFRSVPTRFSRHLNQSGVFSLYKVWHLGAVIVRVTWTRIRSGRDAYLYFTPAGPTRMAMIRDLVLLLAVRWQFAGLVLHCHAAGMTTAYRGLPGPVRRLFAAAYGHPNLVIAVAPDGVAEGAVLDAHETVMVPNGVEDLGPVGSADVHAPARLLFMGLVTPSKGVDVLVEALGLLAGGGIDATLTLAGEVPAHYRPALRESIRRAGLEARVTLAGVVVGEDRRALFAASDVFCFPSFFESESFGMVVAEAMSAGVPVVTTAWRGIPYVVDHGRAGMLVPPRNPEALADSVGRVLSDDALRKGLIDRGRERYEQLFTTEAHLTRMRRALCTITEGKPFHE